MALGMVVPTKFTLQDKMTGPLGAIQGKVDKFANTASSALSAILPKSNFLGSLAGQVAIGTLAAKGMEMAFGAVRDTIASIPEAANRFDEIAKTSVRLGMSTDALQKYRYAAGLAGVSNEQLSTAFMFLNKGLGNGTLVTALEKIDTELARQISLAPDSAAAFKIMAESMSREGDVAKRTAAMMAAFGKSGNALVTMLPTLSEELRNAEKYGNIIPYSALANAELFNDTISRVNSMAQSFGDIIRGSVLRYVTPLLVKLQEWIAANKELIQGKIEGFIQGVVKTVNSLWHGLQLLSPVFIAVRGGIESIIASVAPVIDRTKEWDAENRALIETRIREFVEAVSAAIEKLAPWISKALELVIRFLPEIATFIATLWGLKTVLGVVSAAMSILNAIMHTNPITLVVLAVAALITGFIMLVNKVGGVKEAFIVVGQTIMKVMLTPINLVVDAIQALVDFAGIVVPTIGSAFEMAGQTIMKVMLTPINLVIDAIKGLLTVISKIPGVNGLLEGALEAVKSFQDKMNVTLTGSASTLMSDGLSAYADPAKRWADGGFGRAEREAGAAIAASINKKIQAGQDIVNTALTGSASTLMDSGPEAFLEPYQRAREAELLRQEEAKAAAGTGDNGMEENNDLLRELIAEERKNTEAVNGLGEPSAAGIPGRLNYAQMGQEDFFSIARAGI
jgi:hypothetical protein